MADTDLLDDEFDTGVVSLEQRMRRRPGVNPADLLDDDEGLSSEDIDTSFYTATPGRAADLYATRQATLEDQLRRVPKLPRNDEVIGPHVPPDISNIEPRSPSRPRAQPAPQPAPAAQVAPGLSFTGSGSTPAGAGVAVDFSGTYKNLPFAYENDAQVAPSAPVAQADPEAKPDADAQPDVIADPDHKTNFREVVRRNPTLFRDIQDGVDTNNPAAISQFNQAQFWARVQAMPGGIEKFNTLPAPTKTAVLRKMSEDRMREMFPGYGRGQKLPPQAKEMARSIYNDMRAATGLELDGLPKRQRSPLLGDTPDETIANVLKSPEVDRELLDGMTPADRSKYLRAFIRRAAGSDRKVQEELRFQLSPLLFDKEGTVYDEQIERLFPADGGDKKENRKENRKADKRSDPDQGWVGGTVRQIFADAPIYIASEIVKTPFYYVGGVGAAGVAATGRSPSDGDAVAQAEAGAIGGTVDDTPGDASVPTALVEFAERWTRSIDKGRDSITSQEALSRRERVGANQERALDQGEGAVGKFTGLIGASFGDVESFATTVEQLLGSVAGSLGAAGVGVGVAKGVAKVAGKTSTKVSPELIGAVSSSAAVAAGQVQDGTLRQIFPEKGSNAYDTAKFRFSKGELSLARRADAKAKGYEYDVDADFEQWARGVAARAGVVAGLLTAATAGVGGSVERLLVDTATKQGAKQASKSVAGQAVRTMSVEGLSEGLQEYATGVTTAYYERVRDEYQRTGDLEKLADALADGRAVAQAGFGAILGAAAGGAAGAGFGMLARMQRGSADDVAEMADEIGKEIGDTREARRLARELEPAETAAEIGDTREARRVARELATSDPAPAPQPVSEADLIADAERDPAFIVEGKLSAHVAERRTLEKELAKLAKKTTPADIRRKAEITREIEANKAATPALQAEVDRLTRSDGRFTTVEVREADGSPTGVRMMRDEFDAMQAKQQDILAASRAQEQRASDLTTQLAAPAAQIEALTEQKRTLAATMAAEQSAQRASAIAVAEQRVNLLADKVSKETAFLADLAKGKTAEQLVSKDYKRAKDNAQRRLKEAQKKLDAAQEEFDKADSTPNPTTTRVQRSDEYKARQAQLDAAIAEQKGAAELVKGEAAKARSAAQEIKDEFQATEGFDADKTYTNRQSGLAATPITETSVRRVLDQFAATIKGVGNQPIHIEVIRSDADFKALADKYQDFPNRTFSTLARTDRDGATSRNTIYVNARRIEDANAADLMDELVSKAVAQFGLRALASTDSRFQILLSRIAQSAARTRHGRRVQTTVSDGFINNKVRLVSQEAFNLSFVAELIRTAPKTVDAKGNVRYALPGSLVERASVALSNYLVRSFPRVARFFRLEGTTADLATINRLLSEMTRTDPNGYLPSASKNEWTLFFTEGNLDKQRRTFVNTNRYAGGVARYMQIAKDRAALTLALDSLTYRVSNDLVELPQGVSQAEALRRMEDAGNAVELRIRRTDQRMRNEAQPLIDEFRDVARAAAASAGESVVDFIQKFDTYVQLVSIDEMLSPAGDFYLQKVKLSKEARKEFSARIAKLNEDQKKVGDVAGRIKLGREARADIDRIVQLDQAGKPLPKLSYAGFTRETVAAELAGYATTSPRLKAAFDQAYPALRRVIDRATEIGYESGDYDPLDIAFRARKHFIYRGGQEIDASKARELSQVPGRVIGGRKSIGGADETFAAVGRKDLPKNSTVTAMVELARSVERAETAKTVGKLEFAAQLDPSLAARGEEATRNTRSEPEAFTSSSNFDFNYVGSATEGSTKSAQFIRDDGTRGALTFAHEDVLEALRPHSVEGELAARMASVQGFIGSLYTTRNPPFVLGYQVPRDATHIMLAIIMPRHGVKAAVAYNKAVVALTKPASVYASLPSSGRAAYIATLPANNPLRRYVEQGGWFGAHAQHAAQDLAARFTERGTAERVMQSVPMVRHALDTLPEVADNLFRVAYFDIATRRETPNRLDDATAVVRAGKLMDFSSGSKLQRFFAPYVPFSRSWTNGGFNLLFHDLWQNAAPPLREVYTANGRRMVFDRSRVRREQTATKLLPVMAIMAGAMYALQQAVAGEDDPPPSADDLTSGVMLPGGYRVPYQFGVTKIFGSLGALSAAVLDGSITEDQAARTFGNVLFKEATPLGLQYVPGSDQAHPVQTFISQAAGSNAFLKFFVPTAMNVDNFGRQISRPGGKPSTPDAYKAVSEDYPDIAAYTLRQFGMMSAILDLAMRTASTNQTDEQIAKARGRVLGTNSFVIGGYGVQERVRGQEEELVDDYRRKLDKVKRTPDKADDVRLRRETPHGSTIEGYLRLDQRLRREYSQARKKWVGKPEYSEKITALGKKHTEKRSEALAKLRQKINDDRKGR